MDSIGDALFERFIEPFLDVSAYPTLHVHSIVNTLLLVCPFVYYFFLWHWPTPWCKFSETIGMKATVLMSYFAHVMKIIQFIVLFTAGKGALPSIIGNSLNKLLPSLLRLRVYSFSFDAWTVVDLLLLCGGQALNTGVWVSLGVDGTYYGVRFGEKIPWVTTFPYNIGLPDPQYWGSILSLLGLVNLCQFKNAPYYVLINILSYLFMMWVETKERTPAYKKSEKTS